VTELLPGAGSLAAYDEAVVWTIHTGPFPVAAHYEGDIWLWRITDGEHYTAVVVKIGASVRDASADTLPVETRAAIATRGRVEIERCLRWHEPPREITLEGIDAGVSYWGGHRRRNDVFAPEVTGRPAE
jgi:hypothetical protein